MNFVKYATNQKTVSSSLISNSLYKLILYELLVNLGVDSKYLISVELVCSLGTKADIRLQILILH